MTSPPPEELIWQGRPSHWNWWTHHVLALAVLAGGLALGFSHEPKAIPAAGTASACVFAAAFIKRRGRLYKVTTQRVIEQEGFFGKRVSEVEVSDIRSINLAQGFLQRLFGLGHVEISSAAGEGVEVTFAGIPDASGVKELIRQVRLKAGGPKEQPRVQ